MQPRHQFECLRERYGFPVGLRLPDDLGALQLLFGLLKPLESDEGQCHVIKAVGNSARLRRQLLEPNGQASFVESQRGAEFASFQTNCSEIVQSDCRLEVEGPEIPLLFFENVLGERKGRRNAGLTVAHERFYKEVRYTRQFNGVCAPFSRDCAGQLSGGSFGVCIAAMVEQRSDMIEALDGLCWLKR